jgi:hypothetical protein
MSLNAIHEDPKNMLTFIKFTEKKTKDDHKI